MDTSVKFSGTLWAGTSGLVLPVANKQAFPEEFRAGTRLTYYASLFNSIELNSTFYKMPMPVTFSKWAGEVPVHFRFTVKLWRGITHVPGLRFSPADVNRCLYAADHLWEKKGCLLIQLPPGLKVDAAGQLERLLKTISLSDPDHSWKIAVEFRNRSWYTPEVNTLLQWYRVAYVLHDMPASASPLDPFNDEVVYLRFHGPEGNYRGSYADEFLAEYASYVNDWLKEGKTVYTYFNNTMGSALQNLMTLKTFINS